MGWVGIGKELGNDSRLGDNFAIKIDGRDKAALIILSKKKTLKVIANFQEHTPDLSPSTKVPGACQDQ